MAKKVRFFDDAEDKNVAAVVVFINDSKYYYDEDFTVEVPEADYENLFVKGAIFDSGDGSFKKPVELSAEGDFVFYTPAAAQEAEH